MKFLLPYIISAIGLTVIVFFINYEGTAIPLKELWFVLGFMITSVGAYLVFKTKFKRYSDRTLPYDRLNHIRQLKLTGDKIRITLENAEVKSRFYEREVLNDGFATRTEIINALYGSKTNFRIEEITQTYIVFKMPIDGKEFQFVSHPIPQSSEILRLYILRHGGIDLYVDKSHPENYYFDMP